MYNLPDTEVTHRVRYERRFIADRSSCSVAIRYIKLTARTSGLHFCSANQWFGNGYIFNWSV